MSSSVEMTPMIRVKYSFPDVWNKKERDALYDAVYHPKIREQIVPGYGYGDGSINSGEIFIYPEGAEIVRKILTDAGFTIE